MGEIKKCNHDIIKKRNEKIKETSPEVWEWMKQIVEEHIALGHIIDE